jgi:predicted dehydrogenase
LKKLSRRDFLKQGALLSGALAFPTIIPASALGKDGKVAPSERVTVGIIGCGNRSRFAQGFQDYDKCQIAAVCDPFIDRRLEKKKQYGNCADYSDFRDLFARPEIDTVYICTPDHWHTPMSLMAARAGKDMYTEKPLGLTMEQDFAAQQIVDKYKRIFQYGTQNRSIVQVRMGTELVLNGHIGKVKEIYVWSPKGFAGPDNEPELPVPEGYDYDLWLGPAPRKPFSHARCLRSGQQKGVFHIRDYTIGFLAGWGAHPLDQLQWWADEEKMGIPVKYDGTGTIPNKGMFDTVMRWDVTCTYANGLKLRFIDTPTARQKKIVPHIDELDYDHGTMYIGEDGWVAVSRGSWKTEPGDLVRKGKEPGERRLTQSTSHPANFIDCVLERKQPISSLSSAINSDNISHLCNISILTGRTIRWDPEKRTIIDDDEAVKLMSRPMRDPWTL